LNNLKNYVLIFLFFRINWLTFALIVEVVEATTSNSQTTKQNQRDWNDLHKSFTGYNTHTMNYRSA
jgi:hypothetical protein